MKYIKLIAAIIFVAATAFTACKKSSSDPLGGADIIYINYANSNGEAIHYRVVYGVGNNVDSIVSTGGGTDTGSNGYLTFSYANSSYLIVDQASHETRVDINTNLLIDTVFHGGSSVYTYYQYYGTELGAVNTVTPITSYPYYATTVYEYSYANNDISAISTTGATQSYSYNTSQKGQLGDAQRLPEFLTYGRSYTSSANLPTEMDLNGTWQEKYSYTLDGQGRITQLMKVINNTSGGFNDTATYNYTYSF